MEKGYKKIFWGLILVIFNINLGPINILPDFLGYFFISSGLSIIQKEYENDSFKLATIIANILTLFTLIMSIFNLIGFDYELLNNNILKIGSTLLISAANLVMEFNILSGTISLLMNMEKSEEAELTYKIQRNYTYLYIIALLLISISFNISNKIIALAIVIYYLIIRIYYISIIKKIRNLINDNTIGNDPNLPNEDLKYDTKI